VIKRFLLNILVLLDEVVNTLTLGSPDETISSRAAKASAKGAWFPCLLCKFLDLFEKDHCAKNLVKDAGQDAVIKD
jgi:hypothetical protein